MEHIYERMKQKIEKLDFKRKLKFVRKGTPMIGPKIPSPLRKAVQESILTEDKAALIKELEEVNGDILDLQGEAYGLDNDGYENMDEFEQARWDASMAKAQARKLEILKQLDQPLAEGIRLERMSKIKELVEQARGVKDILEGTKPRVIPSAYKYAHGEGKVGIWWYNLSNKQLFYSKTSEGHFSPEFKDTGIELHRKIQPSGWIRGRIGKYGSHVFAFLYDIRDYVSRLSGEVLADIYNKLSAKSGEDIEYLVDEEGYDLLSEGRIRERSVNEDHLIFKQPSSAEIRARREALSSAKWLKACKLLKEYGARPGRGGSLSDDDLDVYVSDDRETYCVITAQSGDIEGEREWLCTDDDSFAENLALEQTESYIQDSPESFNNLEDFIFMTDTDRRITAGEISESYVEGLSDNDVLREVDDKEGYKTVQEEIDGLDPDEHGYKDRLADLVEQQEQFIADAREELEHEKYEETYRALGDPIKYFVQDQGLYTVGELLKASFISIDYKEMALDVINSDGVDSILDVYDGEAITIDGFSYYGR